MKRKATLSASELSQVIAEEYAVVLRLRDFESVVLRSHLAVEGWLRLLLAVRLKVDPSALPRLSFSSISALALAGLDEESLAVDIRRLNTLRNDIAHEFAEPEYGEKMWPFVARLRRATGQRRVRWIGLGKARFLRLTGKVFILLIKASKESLDDREFESTQAQLTGDMRALFDNPDQLFQKLDELAARLPPSLPDPSDVNDVSAAQTAAVAISKVYEVAMVQLSAARENHIVSDDDWTEITAKANDLRVRGRNLIDIVGRWTDAGFERAVLQQYSDLLPIARWLQERAKSDAPRS